jgi:hypothetical protein
MPPIDMKEADLKVGLDDDRIFYGEGEPAQAGSGGMGRPGVAKIISVIALILRFP